MANHPDTEPEMPPLDPTADPGHAAEEHPAGHGHASHKKKGHGGHAGGHEGGWIMTYCDMITLLIAFFICILTFSSKESGQQKNPKLRDSVLYGPGGSGVVGPTQKGGDQDNLVWRQVMISAHQGTQGSRIPPLYSDPSPDRTKEVLGLLEKSTLGNLSDSFKLRLPLGVFYDEKKQMQPAGQQLLRSLAGNLRRLPYEIYIQVADRQHLDRAVAIARYMTVKEGIEPDRLGVGMCQEPAEWNPSVWFTFVSRK